jgi:hypothetical protein
MEVAKDKTAPIVNFGSIWTCTIKYIEIAEFVTLYMCAPEFTKYNGKWGCSPGPTGAEY